LLDVAVDFLVKNVNSWLSARVGGSTIGQLEMRGIIDENGKWAVTKERIAVHLINVEEDRILKAHLPESTLIDGRHVTLQPELKLNLHLLFAGWFTQYDQALKYLSLVLTYFQSHPSFRRDEYPGLDPRIERLTVELQSLGYEQLNQIWAFVGGKQLPSVVYKVRMVAVQDRAPMEIMPPITAVDLEAHRP
jgi:hypothetical protein